LSEEFYDYFNVTSRSGNPLKNEIVEDSEIEEESGEGGE